MTEKKFEHDSFRTKRILISLLCISIFGWLFPQHNAHDHSPEYGKNIFAVIGDYGTDGPNEAAVAELVKSWKPEYIITTGDNNYPAGAAATIDKNIGKYYHDYIKPYAGDYGSGADTNRFYPSLGNHDLYTSSGAAYYNYFTLPGNERYYDFVKGDIHFFVINSDPSEPDGTSSTSIQASWLKSKLASSQSHWKIVYFHHAPYASDAVHGSNVWMQWPFKAWGADAVLAGHSHIYERIIKENFLYIISGLGGTSKYGFAAAPVIGSKVRFNAEFGALRVDVSNDTLLFRFYAVSNKLIDTYYLIKPDAIGMEEFFSDIQSIIYPNPNGGDFVLHLKTTEANSSFKIQVHDLPGNVLMSKEMHAKSDILEELIRMDPSPAPGIYILVIINGTRKKELKYIVSNVLK